MDFLSYEKGAEMMLYNNICKELGLQIFFHYKNFLITELGLLRICHVTLITVLIIAIVWPAQPTHKFDKKQNIRQQTWSFIASYENNQ